MKKVLIIALVLTLFICSAFNSVSASDAPVLDNDIVGNVWFYQVNTDDVTDMFSSIEEELSDNPSDYQDVEYVAVLVMEKKQPLAFLIVDVKEGSLVMEKTKIVELATAPYFSEKTNKEKKQEKKKKVDDNVYESKLYEIEITSHEVLGPGRGLNYEGEDPVIRIFYNFTIPSYGVKMAPSVGWLLSTKVVQAIPGERKYPELENAKIYDELTETSLIENVMPGETVEACANYVLKDSKAPVFVQFREDQDSVLPDQTFRIFIY